MLPLILPPQSQPVLDSATFQRTWYVYLETLQQYAASAAGIAQYGPRADRLDADIESLTDGAFWMETDTGLVYQWRAPKLEWFYAAGLMSGNFSIRPSTLGMVDTGVLFFALDTLQLYQWNGTAWSLFTQVYQRTQSQLSTFAAALGTSDAGLLVNVTDYAHVLQWTGSGWEWGPGESGSGMLVPFAIAPTGSGWHACDGSSGVKYLKSDGSTGTVTLPNTAGSAAYLKAGGAYSASISAAQVPTIGAPTFTGTPGTTGAASAGTQGNGATANTLTQAAHTHSFTPAGTVSAPTATLPGDPVDNFEALLYFRQ